MTRWLLDAAYLLLLLAVSPYLLWRSWRTGRYRRGWRAKLLGEACRTDPRRGPVVWLHAVSVGEVNLLGTLIERLERRVPGCQCVVSSTTDTGYDLARRKFAPRPVFYCPLDFSWSVARAMRRVRPELLLLAELELWPNLVAAAQRSGARVAVVNGRLSERSARGYARIRPLLRPLLNNIDCIAAQTEEYAARFRSLGAPAGRVAVTGSVKFDGAESRRDNPATAELVRLAGYQPQQVVMLAGSTQAPEESLALQAFQRAQRDHPQLRLIVVPRHPERCGEVAELLQQAEVDFCRRSQLQRPLDAAPEVLLVDVVGELGGWWGRADIAYVGGSMGRRGGQNMIEPAAYGCATSFGPETRNFRDVVMLLTRHEAAVVVRDGQELTSFVRRCLESPEWARELGARAQQLVLAQQGAADATVDLLAPLLAAPRREAA